MKITLGINKTDISIKKGKVTIDLNPETVDFNSEQFAALICSNKVELSALKPGDEFKLGDEVFIVMEHADRGTRVISKEFAYREVRFGYNSNWYTSSLRRMLNNEYFERIAAIVGENNIIPMDRDLTSLDGLDDYGACIDKISLLTVTEYAKYHKILGLKSNYPDWWWLITPISTPSNNYAGHICYIDSDGVFRWCGCDCACGVRPFLNLESSILVSLKK